MTLTPEQEWYKKIIKDNVRFALREAISFDDLSFGGHIAHREAVLAAQVRMVILFRCFKLKKGVDTMSALFEQLMIIDAAVKTIGSEVVEEEEFKSKCDSM